LAEQVWRIRTSENPEPVVLRLSREAQSAYTRFWKDWEHSQGDEQVKGLLNGWSAKLHGQVLRLAGIAHCLREGTLKGEVDGEAMEATVGLVPFLLQEAFRVQNMIGGSRGTASRAERVVSWAEDFDGGTFSSRDLQRHFGWKAPETDPLVESMVDEGVIERLAGQGRKQLYRLATAEV
jgi:hypothetical protein